MEKKTNAVYNFSWIKQYCGDEAQQIYNIDFLKICIVIDTRVCDAPDGIISQQDISY